ncbi:MAG: NAD-dependent epimerase/dehydratase family protein [Cyclobacteriaceae bacterium]|nr:NAD-dependent epimerase/dehydratase family protein [Cyclobacteriaceae bacterium]
MDKVLLTGASGFLGKVIQHELNNVHFITLGRSAGNQVVVDLSRSVPSLPPVDSVIHASGLAHIIPLSEQEEARFYDINVTGTNNLLSALELLNPVLEKFVFISSVAVYGRESGTGITEEAPLAGTSSYAKSKIECEKIIADWCLKNQVCLSIVRLPLLVGKGAPGNLGRMLKVIKEGWYVGVGSGSARKSMVLASDVARFIPVVSAKGGIYNLTDGVHPSMREFEIALSQRLGKRQPFRFPPTLLKGAARVGDWLGAWFPLNSSRLNKLTASLTFSDVKARQIGWQSRSVIEHLPPDL